jgi:hypothetical protein
MSWSFSARPVARIHSARSASQAAPAGSPSAAGSLVAWLASMVAFTAVGVIGLMLPFAAGGAVYNLTGQGVAGGMLGVAGGLAVVAMYLVIACRIRLFDKANHL